MHALTSLSKSSEVESDGKVPPLTFVPLGKAKRKRVMTQFSSGATHCMAQGTRHEGQKRSWYV